MSWHVLLRVRYVIVSPLPGAQFAGSEEAGPARTRARNSWRRLGIVATGVAASGPTRGRVRRRIRSNRAWILDPMAAAAGARNSGILCRVGCGNPGAGQW